MQPEPGAAEVIDQGRMRKKAAVCLCVVAAAAVFTVLLRSLGTVDGGADGGADGPWTAGQPPKAKAVDLNTSCAAAEPDPALCPIGCWREDNTTCSPCPQAYAICSEFGGCDPRVNWSGINITTNGTVSDDPVVCTCLVGLVGDRCTLKADFFSVSGTVTVLLIALAVVFVLARSKSGDPGKADEAHEAEQHAQETHSRERAKAVEILTGICLPLTLRKWLMYQADTDHSSWMAPAYRISPAMSKDEKGQQRDNKALFKCLAAAESRSDGEQIPPRMHGAVLGMSVLLKLAKTLQLGAAAFSVSIPWFERSPIPEILNIPAIDLDTFLPEWFGYDLSFGWQVIGAVILSRILFPADWMLCMCLKDYRSDGGEAEEGPDSKIQEGIPPVAAEGHGNACCPCMNPSSANQPPQNHSDKDLARASSFPKLKAISARETQKNAELADAFKKYDKDGDGLISAEELREARVSQGAPMTEAKAAEIIRKADDDGDGKIDPDEFSKMMASQLSKQEFVDSVPGHLHDNKRDPNVSRLWLDRLFDEFDKDKSGSVDEDEWNALVEELVKRSAPLPEFEDDKKTKCMRWTKKAVSQRSCSCKSSGVASAEETKALMGEEVLKKKKKLTPPEKLEKLQLEVTGLLLIPMTRVVSGIYLGCTYYDGAPNTFDADPSLSCWIDGRWWLYAAVGLYGLFVLITISKAAAHKIGDLSFSQQRGFRPDYPATPEYGTLSIVVQVFTTVIAVAIGKWHPIVSSATIVFTHILVLVYLLAKQPFIHHFMNRLDMYGSSYNIIAYSCAIHATHVDDPEEERPILVYSWAVLVAIIIVALIEVPLICMYGKHHVAFETNSKGTAKSFVVANGMLMKKVEFYKDKDDAERLLREGKYGEAGLEIEKVIRNVTADESIKLEDDDEAADGEAPVKARTVKYDAAVDEAIQYVDKLRKLVCKVEEGQMLLDGSKQALAGGKMDEGRELADKAKQAFDEALLNKPRVEGFDGLAELQTESHAIVAVLENAALGEAHLKAATTAAKCLEAVQAYQSAIEAMPEAPPSFFLGTDFATQMQSKRQEATELQAVHAQKETELAKAAGQED